MTRLHLSPRDHSLAPYRAYSEAGEGRPEARGGGEPPGGQRGERGERGGQRRPGSLVWRVSAGLQWMSHQSVCAALLALRPHLE